MNVRATTSPWDYLIVTASNDAQARAYESQLAVRRRLGLLGDVRHALVVADPGGKRAGSGGSTIYCLREVLNRESGQIGREGREEILRRLRILIIHAGGDSRRLPAYGPCGKIFVPVPGENHSAVPMTLFDRVAGSLLPLPPGAERAGQVVVASGDALLLSDASQVDLSATGMTLLGCHTSPEEAARHGVFCVDANSGLRLYLQKPPLADQQRCGAINRYGQAILDIGVMSFDAATALALLEVAESLSPERELDLYREICCALGAEATAEHHRMSARGSGSRWDDESLEKIYHALRAVPLTVHVLRRCGFLHFGATRQLVAAGLALVQQDSGAVPAVTRLALNTEVLPGGEITGADSWVEGCRLSAPLALGGRNVVVGVDIDEPLSLPEGLSLDVTPGLGQKGQRLWFVRCYGANDAFKEAQYCGRPILEWIRQVGLDQEDVWDGEVAPEDRTLWNARLFPAEAEPRDYRRWLWMFDPAKATPEQKQSLAAARRYNAAEIALLADQEAFHSRRARIRAGEIRRSFRYLFSLASRFSAADLAYAFEHVADPAEWIAELLAEADAAGGFTFSRIYHALSSVLLERGDNPEWAQQLRAAAFRELNLTILTSSLKPRSLPRNDLRPDETIWGRGPARIELGGGWTDTPPYSLEYGGDVANVAVNLNGQPPIHCYCRVIAEPVVRFSSIDVGRHLEITELQELLDYRRPGDVFALAKAALAISGFSPEMAPWPQGVTLADMLDYFGGGIELTTLVGIPKGSGLGTSSILGGVILAVVERMLGRTLTQRELFHDVLRLEQALTTGGGWQDQIGGGVGGTKITSTAPGLIPAPRIHYLPNDLLDPKLNGGSTLLYYTGLTRLAKNILEQIVGGYLDRDRRIMSTLAQEHEVARAIADALAGKDAALLGHYIDVAWGLQKQLCGEVTNEAIESLLARVRPHVHGMRISGAGSGGFLLAICKSPDDAAKVRDMLEREPLNERSRFFEYDINHAGLEVTCC